ncbi:thioesterase family protein [Halomicronema sp. CCY15110]|uniref:acyl-CoA thioesterase n=1 Tax=Halomicronema sp. CCY15110 TaxID=2767773 RepID=UPI001951D3BA|nr:thioesterase family protein [Halomicronema sp. CCY15110]
MKVKEKVPEQAFEYRVRVQPHHTDYGGVVWHGNYVAWLEAARVEWLRSHHIEFADWVKSGVDLPVVDLSIQYRQPLTLGAIALIKCWLLPSKNVRLVWQYEILNADTQERCASAQVTLVPIQQQPRKILRRLPEPMQSDLARLMASSSPSG